MDQQENSPWQYKPDGAAVPDSPDNAADQPANQHAPPPKDMAWQAAEFIEHNHPASWYAALVLITAALAAVIQLTTKDYFATGTIVLVGIIAGVFAGHKPGQAQYEITDSGLSVNGKTYPYHAFKSFTIYREGPLSSVSLFPLRRFMPPVSAYFDPAEEPKITDAIGNYLPYEERKLDNIDRLSRRLRL